ncbi:MAG: PorV/PorQ family protein [Bacteroidetes bacterium]|nr:PorV/PorQ family protein [Bacteroidota bacterium]
MNRAQYIVSSVLIFFLLSASHIYSQSSTNYTFKNTSLDIAADASGIAMGESFVANPENHAAYFENPAAIAINTGMQIFYNYRSHNWMALAENMKYFSAGGCITTSIGNFGFAYNKFTTGDLTSYSDGAKITSSDVNRTFMLSYSNEILKNFSAGISAKLFNRSLNAIGENYTITSTNAFLFDIGLLYQSAGFKSIGKTTDKISAGISLQNFGTDYKEEVNSFYNYIQKLPRFLRIGFAYQLNTIVGQRLQANVDFLLTGEYQRLLNPGDSEQNDVNYWGAGIEATLLKIVSLRLGGVASPENSILWDKGKFNLRYGIGLNFPLAVLGFGHPVTIKFDYAVMPINQTSFDKSQKSLYAFGVSLVYGKLFL